MSFDAGNLPFKVNQQTNNVQNANARNVKAENAVGNEDSLFSEGTMLSYNCPGVDHSIVVGEFFTLDTRNLDSLKEFFDLPADAEIDMSKVAVRKDGQITDFYVDGKRYCVRYDAFGKANKVIEMDLDENGNVTNQKIRNYDKAGFLENTVNYQYTNDGQIKTVKHAKYGSPEALWSKFLGGVISGDMCEDVKYDKEGRVTDFYVGDKRYSFRYDKNGEVQKVITQAYHENGNVASQYIRTMLNTGFHGADVQEDIYKYNEKEEQISHQGFLISQNEYWGRIMMID